MKQFNALPGNEPTEPLREWSSQISDVHFKFLTFPLKTSLVVFSITWRLNYHDVDNGGDEVHPSECPFESTSGSVPYPYTTPIKSIDYYNMYQVLELLHSEHEYDILVVGFHIIQD